VLRKSLAAVFLLLASTALLYAQTKPVPADNQPWWKHAVFYEVCPRSFADTNDNGIGDLNGIAAKLSYLQWLGVDAIWITPCYPSYLEGCRHVERYSHRQPAKRRVFAS
jgi:alpha-glucosidase